jgi:transcription elongation factor S-II
MSAIINLERRRSIISIIKDSIDKICLINQFQLDIDTGHVAESIEDAVYKWIGEFYKKSASRVGRKQDVVQVYIDKNLSLISNMGTITGEVQHSLIYHIFTGTIEIDRLPYLTCEQLCSSAKHWQHYNQEMDMESEMKHLQSDIKERKKHVKSAFRCIKSNCRSNDIDYYEMQTRSADEPATTFFTCNECGWQWKK